MFSTNSLNSCLVGECPTRVSVQTLLLDSVRRNLKIPLQHFNKILFAVFRSSNIIVWGGVLLVAGNLMVILVVSFSRRLRSITNFFLANLAVADLCVGVFCVYQNISIYLVSR
jgi:hypothetical protein